MATEWLEEQLNKEIAEVYFDTLFWTSLIMGIHQWNFEGRWPVYKPQKSLIIFFIKSLKKIYDLGFNAEALAKRLNAHGVFNLFYAEIEPWSANDVFRLLSVSKSGLVLVN